MKNLSKALRLNKRSIQILDDKALVDIKGGNANTDTQDISCANRDSCSRVTTHTQFRP